MHLACVGSCLGDGRKDEPDVDRHLTGRKQDANPGQHKKERGMRRSFGLNIAFNSPLCICSVTVMELPHDRSPQIVYAT